MLVHGDLSTSYSGRGKRAQQGATFHICFVFCINISLCLCLSFYFSCSFGGLFINDFFVRSVDYFEESNWCLYSVYTIWHRFLLNDIRGTGGDNNRDGQIGEKEMEIERQGERQKQRQTDRRTGRIHIWKDNGRAGLVED